MNKAHYKTDDFPLLLFDSHCLVCDGFVRFIIRYDRQKKLKFSGLHTDKAIHEIEYRNISIPQNGTVILLFKNHHLTQSDAVIAMLDVMCLPNWIISLFRAIPQSWRDGLYSWIARNRYRFFTERTSCPLPDPEEAWRFV